LTCIHVSSPYPVSSPPLHLKICKDEQEEQQQEKKGAGLGSSVHRVSGFEGNRRVMAGCFFFITLEPRVE